MRSGDLSDVPNPFAIRSQSAAGRRRSFRPVAMSIKLFALVALGFIITLVAGTQSRLWLANRLTHDFESLSPTEKGQRLTQLAELGSVGIEPLVRALADENRQVARTAHDLLSGCQDRWSMLAADDRSQRQRVLVDAIAQIAIHIPDDRTTWPAGLLQQTMLDTVRRRDDVSQNLYRHASQTLEGLALSERPGPSVLATAGASTRLPQRLEVRSRPLPVTASEPRAEWTDWPPPTRVQKVANSSTEAAPPTSGSSAEEVAADATPAASPAGGPSPTVYRSSANQLREVTPGNPVVLANVDSPDNHSQPQSRLVESPMETYDDQSVMRWLGSPHQALREQAKLELIRRGYDGGQILLATKIFSGDVATRIALVDQIAHASHLDPRPWLLLLLSDEHREVQLRAISVLATMDDPAIEGKLRMHLSGNPDPIVAARLRRVLDLR